MHFASLRTLFLYGESSCLAHVINLATQALIGGYSKTKFFDPEKPEDHTPDVEDFERDVVGLVRAITVKVSL
jgi:hypothetical protein